MKNLYENLSKPIEKETNPIVNFFVFNQNKTIPLIVVIQLLVILVLGYLYFFTSESTQYQKIINDALDAAEIEDESETPSLLRLSDVEILENENAIQQEVYKDAENGDYVLLFSDLMIIYRDSEDKIIYKGDSPAKIADNNTQTLINNLVAKAKEEGIIADSTTESPELSVVTDVNVIKESDPEFYSDVVLGDVIAVFPEANIILIYRSETQTIFKSGNVDTVITPK